MRSRLALMLALMLVMGTVLSLTAVSALASDYTVAVQDSPDEDEPLVGEDEATEGDGGAEGEETGAEEGQTETAEETGPVWTYQMSKISIALLVLLALGIGGAYYNFVAKRQKEGV